MDKLRNISIVSIKNSHWIKCNKVTYIENDNEIIQYIPQSHDSCAILVHNIQRNVFLLVKQFRAAAYFNEIGITQSINRIVDPIEIDPLVYSPSLGITLELCAGLIDHDDKSIKEHAAMELYEELGLKVNAEDLQSIVTHKLNSSQNMFFAQVTDKSRVGMGGGVQGENEMIDTFELSHEDVRTFITSQNHIKPAGLTFAFLWFLAFKSQDDNKGSLGSLSDVPIIDLDSYKTFPVNLKIVKVEQNQGCGNLVLSQATFERGNCIIKWDLLHSYNSFALLLHDTQNDCFLLNRKFKLGTYLSTVNHDNQSSLKTGISIDVIRMDIGKGHDPLLAAQDFLNRSNIKFSFCKNLNSCRNNSGISGTRVSLFYVQIENSEKFHNDDIKGDLVQVPVTIGIPFALQFKEKSSITSMALMWYYVFLKDAPN